MRPRLLLLCAGAAALTAPATAQARYTFSIDWKGPTIALPDSAGGVPITEGDILVPAAGVPTLGPLAPPSIFVPHGAGGLGLVAGCVGHPPGTPCPVEVDALSFGLDAPVTPAGLLGGQLWWSVDEFAPGIPAPVPPNLTTEAPPGDTSADSFLNARPMPPGPLPPFAYTGHVGTVDGDGLPSGSGFAYPGSGLVEPNPPGGGLPNPGDNLDAVDVLEAPAGVVPVAHFSLDAPWPDPLTGIPHNGSAPIHGVSSADVLTTPPFAPGPVVWAPAPALGLDLVGGFSSDDLDALALWENGSGVYEPSMQPFDWLGGGTDMLLFSVRRGSAVIGAPDSFFGMPIEEGDILTTPFPTALGGVSPFPAIFIAAENLDLGTLRTGTAALPFGDDLNALDVLQGTLRDCDGNGVEDAVDIAVGTHPDVNMNGIPDPCESGIGSPFCFCTAAAAPCGNAFPTGGCLNPTGTGAVLGATGSTSVGADNLVLTTMGMNPGTFALTFMGTAAVGPVVLQNGLICVGGTIYRFPPYATGAGTGSLGPGIVAWTLANNPPAGQIAAFQTWHFQTWYRDIPGLCGGNSNLSNALSVTFTP